MRAAVIHGPHDVRLDGWASMWGMRYLKITGEDGFDALDPGETPLLVEILPDAEETKAFWQTWDAR